MKTKLTLIKRAGLILLLSTLSLQPSTVFAQVSAFTYQGRLNANGAPANGNYDFIFQVFDAASVGSSIGGSVATNNVAVSNGLFAVTIDFGASPFTGPARWLEIQVSTNSAAVWQVLSPRSQITSVPYALTASNLSGTLSAAQLSGTLPATALAGSYSGAVSLNNPANSFGGNGAGLLNVDATTLGGLPGAAFWQASGNSGTTPGAEFLGTTDNNALELKVNGARALRLEPNANGPNYVGGYAANSVASGVYGATIGGGGGVIFGGPTASNTIGADNATIGGGSGNLCSTPRSTIAGGIFNTVSNGWSSSVLGGVGNTATGTASTIGGGEDNVSGGGYAAVGGGYQNVNGGGYGFVGAGFKNTNSASYGMVAGGANNLATNDYAAIGGGYLNASLQRGAAVFGGEANRANARSAFVGGGINNNVDLIGYGSSRDVAGYGVIAGGNANTNTAFCAFIGSGQLNWITNSYGVIGGGYGNQSLGSESTVLGGDRNLASGSGASIGGGFSNTNSGLGGAIPGGGGNQVSGSYGLAAGQRAKAVHGGAFVWSDSRPFDFASTNANSFSARCVGGARFVTAIDGSGNPTAGVVLSPGGTSWGTISDRNSKKNFRPTDGRAILEKLAAVPVQQWNYKWESDHAVPHLGPMAQDFKAAFYPGRDDKIITTQEIDGVALAAIQGLNQKLEEERTENAELKARLEKLEQLVTQKTRGAQ